MTFSVSYNESFSATFLLGIFILLILRFITDKQNPLTIKKAFFFFLTGLCILISAIVIEKVIELVVVGILNRKYPAARINQSCGNISLSSQT